MGASHSRILHAQPPLQIVKCGHTQRKDDGLPLPSKGRFFCQTYLSSGVPGDKNLLCLADIMLFQKSPTDSTCNFWQRHKYLPLPLIPSEAQLLGYKIAHNHDGCNADLIRRHIRSPPASSSVENITANRALFGVPWSLFPLSVFLFLQLAKEQSFLKQIFIDLLGKGYLHADNVLT